MTEQLTPEDLEIDAYYQAELEAKQNGTGVRRKFVGLNDQDRADFAAMELLHPNKSITFVWDKVEQERAKQSSKKPPIILGAAMALALPEIPYLVRGLGMVGGGGAPDLIAGFGFSGKTVAEQSLLLACAADVPVWGLHSPEPDLSCVHVDLEQGERLTVRRYQRLAAAMGVRLEDLGTRLALCCNPGLQLDKAYRDQWLWLMEKRQLMVVDSVRAAMAGIDENDSRVRDGIDFLGGLSSETGCRAHLIHHARKPYEGGQTDGRFSIRGSGAIFDAVDGAWLFSANKGEPVMVEHVKARSHGEPLPSFGLSISDVVSGSDPRWGLSVAVSGLEAIEAKRAQVLDAKAAAEKVLDAQRIRGVLADGKRLPRNELAACSRLNGGRFARAWTYLMELGEGQTEIVKAGRTTKHIHYLVTK